MDSISHLEMRADAVVPVAELGDVDGGGGAAVGGGVGIGRVESCRLDPERDLEWERENRRRRLRSAQTAIRHAAAAQRRAQTVAARADSMPTTSARDQRSTALALLC